MIFHLWLWCIYMRCSFSIKCNFTCVYVCVLMGKCNINFLSKENFQAKSTYYNHKICKMFIFCIMDEERQTINLVCLNICMQIFFFFLYWEIFVFFWRRKKKRRKIAFNPLSVHVEYRRIYWHNAILYQSYLTNVKRKKKRFESIIWPISNYFHLLFVRKRLECDILLLFKEKTYENYLDVKCTQNLTKMKLMKS